MTATDLALLHRVWEFLEEEAENRSAAGSAMSDYEREPRELAEELGALIGTYVTPTLLAARGLER